jgi:DNA-binding transcriptional MerR regulator
MDKGWDLTGSLARKVGVEPDTIRRYADEGLLECTRLANGQRLFPPGSEAKARKILSERLARCGRNPRAAA